MIDERAVRAAVEEWLEGKDYFLVALSVTGEGSVSVVIDHAEGVWIEDCASLSRHIEERIDRDEEDYELEVGSAGLGQPFQVRRQWETHVGKPVETQTKDGRRLEGTLVRVGDESFDMEVTVKVKPEGAKRPRMENQTVTLSFDDVAYTKYLIKIK